MRSRSNEKPDTAAVRARIPLDKKQRFAALARERGVSEARLIRQLILQALSAAEGSKAHATLPTSSEPSRRKDRVTVLLHPQDRRAIQELAAARNVRAARYIAALVRAHLKTQVRLPIREAELLRKAVDELNAVRIELNGLVAAVNQGAPWVDTLRETLEQMLKVFEKISFHLREFARTNRRSWQSARLPDSDI